jgi:hypothetical protein
LGQEAPLRQQGQAPQARAVEETPRQKAQDHSPSEKEEKVSFSLSVSGTTDDEHGTLDKAKAFVEDLGDQVKNATFNGPSGSVVLAQDTSTEDTTEPTLEEESDG